MALPDKIVSQFAKLAKGDEPRSEGATVTGTAVEYDGTMYVRLDGSEQLTPIASSTTGMKDGDRITVLVKNHKVTVSGNTTDKSVTSTELSGAVNQFDEIVANKVSTDYLEAHYITADEIEADYVKTEVLDAEYITADEIEATYMKTANLDAEYARIDFANIGEAAIDNLFANEATIEKLDANYASIDDLDAVNATITNLNSTYATIDFANIGEAAIEKLFSDSGIIGDLVMSDGHVTGTLVGVTIKGDLIEGNTIVADKLVIKGTDGLFYKLNTDGVDISAEQTEYNSLNGSIITAKSVTAEKIAVDDLVAFNATIGGFKITDDSIYSGVKADIDSPMPGVYMDDSGRFSLGDMSNYLKFYKDTDGKWKLVISADSIRFASGQDLSDMSLLKEADGGIVDCGDTAGMPLAGLTVYGQTRQNLWVNPTGTSGISCTSNSDGSITVSGTGSGRSVSSVSIYMLKPGVTYTASVDKLMPGMVCFAVYFYNGESVVAFFDFGKSTQPTNTFTVPSSFTHIRYICYAPSGTTVSGTYRVMLNEGSEAQPWCPPGLNSVSAVEVATAGKNLMPTKEYKSQFWARDLGDAVKVVNSLTGLKMVLKYEVTLLTADDPSLIPTSRTGAILRSNAGVDHTSQVEFGSGFQIGMVKTVTYCFMVDEGGRIDHFYTYGCGNSNDSSSRTNGTADVRILLRPATEEDNWSKGAIYTVNEPIPDDEWDGAPVTFTEVDLLGNRLRSLPDGTRDTLTVDSAGNVTMMKRVGVVNLGGLSWVKYGSNVGEYEGKGLPDRHGIADQPAKPPILCSALVVEDINWGGGGADNSAALSWNSAYKNSVMAKRSSSGSAADLDSFLTSSNAEFVYPLEEPQTIPLGMVDLPALNASGANVWVVASDAYGNTYTLDPDIHAIWYAENASALKNFASKAELKVESDQIKATVEETYSTKEEVSTTYATKSSVTQTANSIKQEVSETYTTKTDASATYATKTSLSTVEQTVDGLSSTVSSNYKTLNDKFNSYYTKTQVDQKEDAIQLNAQRMAGINYNQAKMVYTDPCFEKGLNGVKVYNNANNGNVTITRQSGTSSDPFTFSNYRLMIQNKGSSSPGCGGFYFGNNSRANAVFLYRIWALIPTGRNINWASNSFGTGGTTTWLSSRAGTGAFEEYVCVATCGSTGEFSSIGFFYIDGAVGTSSAPVTWYVAYATCFDVTNKSDYSTLRVDVDSISSRVVDAEGNISSLEQTSSGLELRLTQAEKDVDTAQSTANTAKTAANNAAKTATNYLKFDSSGLVVGNHTGTLQGNVLVDSTGMSVRNGTTVYAKYAAALVELGRNSTSAKVKMCGGALEISAVANGSTYDSVIKGGTGSIVSKIEMGLSGMKIDTGGSGCNVDGARVGSPKIVWSGSAWKSGSKTMVASASVYRLFAALVSGWGSGYLIGVLIGNQISFFKAEAWDSYDNPANFAVAGIRINVSGNTWTLNGAARVQWSGGYVYPFGGITAIYGIY